MKFYQYDIINSFIIVFLCLSFGQNTQASKNEDLIVSEDTENAQTRFLRAIDSGRRGRNEKQKRKLSNRPIFLIVSYDGFRYDYFRKANTPNLDWIKRTGISAPYIKPQFPSKTFPNHHSLATGLHPESHGVIDNNVFDPLYNTKLAVTDEKFWVYSSDVVPIWVVNEWNGGVSGVMMWPGSNYGYGENNTKATYVQNWVPQIQFESRVDMAIDWLVNETNPANLVLLYIEEPDEHGHGFGPDSSEVKNFIEKMDNVTGYIINRLKQEDILDVVNVIFLSDHGFEQINQSNIINISTLVKSEQYEFYGGSPILHIRPKEGVEVESLYKQFESVSRYYNFTPYLKEEISQKKPYWHYNVNRRLQPILLLADPGYVFDDFYENMDYYDKKFNAPRTSSRTYGTHGYDNHYIHMHPYFRAKGPLFRSGIEIEPFENIDLFPLMCKLLKIPTPPNNGTIPNVKLMLFHSGFYIGAHTGWVIGAGVAVGFIILAIILSLIAVKKKRDKGRNSRYWPDSTEATIGYRFNRRNENSIDTDMSIDGGRTTVTISGLMRRATNLSEEKALLSRHLSDDSVSSSEFQVL